MDDAGIKSIAVTQLNPDFELLTRALHATYQLVKGLPALGPAIELAFSSSGPVLLELHESTV